MPKSATELTKEIAVEPVRLYNILFIFNAVFCKCCLKVKVRSKYIPKYLHGQYIHGRYLRCFQLHQRSGTEIIGQDHRHIEIFY